MKIKLKKFKVVKSTNDVALKLIKNNISGPILISSKKQTGGRGRVGKKWVSKKGNIFLSLFFALDKTKVNFRQFAILNALLLKNLISKKIKKKIKIKWPNDLLYNDLKFCGILQELIEFKKINYLIVGIGVNTNVVPKNKSFQSTCLKNIVNTRISNQKFINKIQLEYEKFLNQINKMSFTKLKRKYK